MPKDNLKDKKKEILSNVLANIKMNDAGIKPKKGEMDICCSSDEKIHYPNLYLNAEEVPALSSYEVGDTVILVAEAKIISHSKNENMKHSRESFDLQLKRIGCRSKVDDKE